MERKLIAFTFIWPLGLLATPLAHASHPLRNIQIDGTAHDREFVAAKADTHGRVHARQVLPATGAADDQRATSRVIYLNRDGVVLVPGDNDSRSGRSTIVSEAVEITPWDIDDETWDETVSCIRTLYSRFDVTVTDVDPGTTPHIEAVFGGHPNDVGLPDNVAGVSPFTTDCSIIENSIVFTFTDVLPDNSQTMCEVMGQEIAHSYGLDHQMTPSDPMTYLDYDGERSFKNEMADCGEFESRDCGINGSVCRDGQNSVSLLASRLGRRSEDAPEDITTAGPEGGGCATSGSGGPLSSALLALMLVRMLRTRKCCPGNNAATSGRSATSSSRSSR